MLLQWISIYFFVTLLVTMYLTMFSIANSKINYIRLFALLNISISIYIFGYLLELNSLTLEKMLFWNQFQYFALPFIPSFWLLLGLMYTEKINSLYDYRIVFVLIIPAMTFIMRITNQIHKLYYTSCTIEYSTGIPMMLLSKGYWYYIQTFYVIATTILTAFLFFKAFRRSGKAENDRFRLLFIASIIPITSMILIIINPFDLALDYTAIMFPIMLIVIGYAITRHDFLEIKTLGRDKMFEESQDAMLILSRKMKIMDYNKAALTFFQSNNLEINSELLMNNQYEKNMLIELLKKNGQQKYTNKLNNKTFYWEINTNKIELNKRGVFGYLKCIRDVTQKLETQKNLQKIARTDELSQLLNRREFFRRGNHLFKECMTYKSRVTMAMVDIDFFKKVNDTYGHSIGDLVIKAIGKVLKKSFREDDIVARTGGEEFAVLFKNVPKEEGIKRLECFRKEIESAIMVPENHEVKVTVSIGLAFYNEGTNSLDELMVNADKALYQAKRKGRNRLELFDGDENV